MCPKTLTNTCFYFDSIFSFHSDPFDCPPNERISTTNVTAEMIICYSWGIRSQSIIGILSQLGICTSILSLIGLLFKFLYYVARQQYWGIPLIIGLGLVMIMVLIIMWSVFRVAVSFIVFILVSAAIIILLNTLFLVHTVNRSKNHIHEEQTSGIQLKLRRIMSI
ncbi:unnamed protein product [Rotaria magnacalcarata]|nr:unnamed protein product [Rotaria magnacalcarata]CAF1520338.1 unnamed protein product [Rotaria magnacalcarata]CAF2091555.1 unnamed protein product [Rotaria magnacalcarata]CAF2201177.1 unnamed protein product [Rotaria magnacalcarata]CAF3745884.1 unnamed protein product [Rotaria magnacalcarata]